MESKSAARLVVGKTSTSSPLPSFFFFFFPSALGSKNTSGNRHGYLLSSGLPTLFADYVQSCTVEGDNYLLTQQTARYLLKAYQQGREGKKAAGNARYLENVEVLLAKKSSVMSPESFLDPAIQREAYEHRAALVIHQVATQIAHDVSQGKSFEAAWNNSLVEINRASKAHCYLTILISFISAVEGTKTSKPELHPVLKRFFYFILFF